MGEKRNLGQGVDDLIKSAKDSITRKLGGFSFLYAYHKARRAKKQKDKEWANTDGCRYLFLRLPPFLVSAELF